MFNKEVEVGVSGVRYNIIHKIRLFETVLRITQGGVFRSRDLKNAGISYSNLQMLVKDNVVKVVAQETEQREIENKRSRYRQRELNILEVETNKQVDRFDEMREGFTYILTDKKIITACYNVYKLNYQSLESFKRAIECQLQKIIDSVL